MAQSTAVKQIGKQIGSDFSEIGVSGLNRSGGHLFEEFLRELQGFRGMKIYREMSNNDAVIGAILFSFQYLARQVTWRVDPASEDEADKEKAEFVWGALNDMSQSWNETLSEIFSMLPFGWTWLEVVLKTRNGDRFCSFARCSMISRKSRG